MVMKADSRGIPPYIGWATWNRLTRLMKTFVPPKLDRSYFNSLGFSGTQYSQAIRAFLFLRLMDDDKKPTEALRKLVMGNDDERRTTLKTVIERAYQPFFASPGPREATMGDLESYLRTQGAKGVLDKCATFFLAAAREADIQLSPQLAGEFGRKTGRRVKGRKKGLIKQAELPTRTLLAQNVAPLPAGGVDLSVISFVAGLPENQQDKWVQAYVKVTRALKDGGL